MQVGESTLTIGLMFLLFSGVFTLSAPAVGFIVDKTVSFCCCCCCYVFKNYKIKTSVDRLTKRTRLVHLSSLVNPIQAFYRNLKQAASYFTSLA